MRFTKTGSLRLNDLLRKNSDFHNPAKPSIHDFLNIFRYLIYASFFHAETTVKMICFGGFHG